MNRKKTVCALVVTANGFILKLDKSLQIYFFCVKRQAKNDFLKDVENTVTLEGKNLLPWGAYSFRLE